MAELIYKQLKKDLEQKAIVAADPATTAMVVTKQEFLTYKTQTQQTLDDMVTSTNKVQESVGNLINGHTPVKGLTVYREDIADNNGIAITENQDSNLAIYKVNQDGSASDVKLLLNNKEVALKEDLDGLSTNGITTKKLAAKTIEINSQSGSKIATIEATSSEDLIITTTKTNGVIYLNDASSWNKLLTQTEADSLYVKNTYDALPIGKNTEYATQTPNPDYSTYTCSYTITLPPRTLLLGWGVACGSRQNIMWDQIDPKTVTVKYSRSSNNVKATLTWTYQKANNGESIDIMVSYLY